MICSAKGLWKKSYSTEKNYANPITNTNTHTYTHLNNISCSMWAAMVTLGFLSLFMEKIVRLEDSSSVVLNVSAAVPAPQQLKHMGKLLIHFCNTFCFSCEIQYVHCLPWNEYRWGCVCVMLHMSLCLSVCPFCWFALVSIYLSKIFQ